MKLIGYQFKELQSHCEQKQNSIVNICFQVLATSIISVGKFNQKQDLNYNDIIKLIRELNFQMVLEVETNNKNNNKIIYFKQILAK